LNHDESNHVLRPLGALRRGVPLRRLLLQNPLEQQ
jgi:hypothetical protein